MRNTPQLKLLKNQSSSYGGELLKTRSGRSGPRPLDTKNTMHLVLRSSKAKGSWSFQQNQNKIKIKEILRRFSKKYGITILSLGNVGNHLHLHIKLSNRFAYIPFIKAITSAVAMAITGASRWKPLKKTAKDKFWDYRPFTRVIRGFKAFLNLRDYIQINQLEGFGLNRAQARWIVSDFKTHAWKYNSG